MTPHTARSRTTTFSQREYDRAVKRLNTLLDEIGSDESHPLYELLDTLGTLLHVYEEKHHTLPDCCGADTVRFLMDEHGLTQSHLPEAGSRSVVSEISNAKRELTIQQIRSLAKRFHVSPAVFVRTHDGSC